MSDRIKKIFKNLKEKNRKALISFSVAGFPNDETSLEICKVLSDSGVHIHELNMPHAEAQADGPIIQLANIESIKKGINLDKIFRIAEKLRLHNPNLGICLMGYLNNIFIYGIEKFAEKANKAGVDALICVDLPTDVKEEKQIRDALKKVGISLIKLITPTTNEYRIKEKDGLFIKHGDFLSFEYDILFSSGIYQDGEKHGLFYFYDKDGKVKFTRKYNNGFKVD